MLFWKNAHEATEIQDGYSPVDQYGNPGVSKKKKNSRKTLSPEEENEIIVLAEEYAALTGN